MVVDVIVTQPKAVDALPQQIHLPMSDQQWIMRIWQHRVECPDQAKPTISLAQQQNPVITGDIPTRDVRFDLSTIKA